MDRRCIYYQQLVNANAERPSISNTAPKRSGKTSCLFQDLWQYRPYLFRKNVKSNKGGTEYKRGEDYISKGTPTFYAGRSNPDLIYQQKSSQKDRKEALLISQNFRTSYYSKPVTYPYKPKISEQY